MRFKRVKIMFIKSPHKSADQDILKIHTTLNLYEFLNHHQWWFLDLWYVVLQSELMRDWQNDVMSAKNASRLHLASLCQHPARPTKYRVVRPREQSKVPGIPSLA